MLNKNDYFCASSDDFFFSEEMRVISGQQVVIGSLIISINEKLGTTKPLRNIIFRKGF